MKLIGIGIDIEEVGRIKGARFPKRLAELFLTQNELGQLADSKDPVAFITSRFAVKEAVIKSFPVKLEPHDFEVVKIGNKPAVNFILPEYRKYNTKISLAHSPNYVVGAAHVSYDGTS